MRRRVVLRAVAALVAVVSGASAVGAASASAAVTTPRLENASRNVVVNWGSHVDPAQAAAAAGFLDGADRSGYLRGLASAYGVTSSATYLGAGLVPDANLPSTVDRASIAAAVGDRITAGTLPARVGFTNYVVLLPRGVAPADAQSSPFCSTHYPFTRGTTTAFIIVLADYTDALSECGGGAADAADAVSVNLSRQLVNTITDPDANGSGVTQTATGAEVGDACAVAGATGNVDGYPVQPWWSSATNGCSFGVTGTSVTSDIPRVTNTRDATFRLHDTAGSQTTSFTCTVDDGDVACDTSRPLALTGIAAGAHHLQVQASGLGSATYDWLIDRTPPVASLLRPTAPVTVGRSITVSYRASDAGGAGVAAYDVRYRSAAWNRGFGGWLQPPAWQGTASATVTLAVQPGREYCFSVRAHDRADNVQPSWSASRCTAVPVDDRTLTAGKGWRRVASAVSFRGTLSVSSTRGARLRLPQAHAGQVALLVRTCPTCGRLDLYRGSVLWRSVNTRSARPHTRVLLLQPPFPPRTMTLSLQVRTAGKPVYVDGVAVRHS